MLSYTHTYAGQALAGERIEARGMVEVVGNMKRLVVETTREAKGEWIRSLTVMEGRKYIETQDLHKCKNDMYRHRP